MKGRLIFRGFLNRFIPICYGLFCAFVFFGCSITNAKNQYYYCYKDPNKMSAFDQMVAIKGKKGHRTMPDYGMYDSVHSSHDEGDKITMVYTKNDHGYGYFEGKYDIVQIDLSSNPVYHFIGLGVHTTYKKFKEKKPNHTVSQWNLNPELIKYLPKRPQIKTFLMPLLNIVIPVNL